MCFRDGMEKVRRERATILKIKTKGSTTMVKGCKRTGSDGGSQWRERQIKPTNTKQCIVRIFWWWTGRTDANCQKLLSDNFEAENGEHLLEVRPKGDEERVRKETKKKEQIWGTCKVATNNHWEWCSSRAQSKIHVPPSVALFVFLCSF